MDGTVNGSLQGGGGTFVLSGNVKGNADIRGATVEISGTVGGKAVLSADQLNVGPGARITGDLRYWTRAGEMDFKGVAAGKVQFDQTLQFEKGKFSKGGHAAKATVAFFSGLVLFSILSAALVILLLMLLTRTFFQASAEYMKRLPWYSLLIGFLYFLTVPALAVIAACTIIGLPVTLVLAAVFAMSILLAKPLTALVFAHWLQLRGNRHWAQWKLFSVALGLYVVLKALILIPLIGWLLIFCAVCLAFGALLMTKKERYLMVR